MAQRNSKNSGGEGLMILFCGFLAIGFAIEYWYIAVPLTTAVICYFGYKKIAKNKLNKQLLSEMNDQIKDPTSLLGNALRSIDKLCITDTKPKELKSKLKVEEIEVAVADLIAPNGAEVKTTKGASRNIKIRFRGEELNVEEFAMAHFNSRGYSCVYTEATMWNLLWYCLFYDLYWINVPGANISNRSDMPSDFFKDDSFFENRRGLICKRALDLGNLSKELLKQELGIGFAKLKSKPGRLVSADAKAETIELQQMEMALELIGFYRMLPLLFQLMSNQKDFRKGLPDLFVWKNNDSEFFFCEVKSQNDRISKEQCYWFEKLRAIGFEARLCQISVNEETAEAA